MPLRSLHPFRLLRAGIGLALMGALAVPPARALSIQFHDITPGGMSQNQLDAFNAAASLWQSRLFDPVTVYLTISFQNDGNNGILGSTDSSVSNQSYSAVRSALTTDRTSALDNTAVSHLQSGSFLSFQATNLDLSTRFDNDTNPCLASGASVPCATNNQFLAVTTANAKALGFTTGTSAANPDGTILFNGNYAGLFDFTRGDGIDAGSYDFVSIAAHEIGHALGFVSGVDDVDYCSPLASGRCNGIAGLVIDNAFSLERRPTYSVLDLFRFSAPGVLDLRVSGRPYFSVDGGDTSIEAFSNGQINGSDQYQASHFIPGRLNLMNPYGFTGQAVDPSAADLAAFDAIGWDLVVAVPEPASWVLILAGIAVVGRVTSRRGPSALRS